MAAIVYGNRSLATPVSFMGSIDQDREWHPPIPSYYTRRVPKIRAYQNTVDMSLSTKKIFLKHGYAENGDWWVTVVQSSQDYSNRKVPLNYWIIIDECGDLINILSDKEFQKNYEPQF